MANVTSLLISLCNNFKDSASTSNSGTLPSQSITNPRTKQLQSAEHSTRSAKKTVNIEIQDLNSPRPIPSKLPYPERMKIQSLNDALCRNSAESSKMVYNSMPKRTKARAVNSRRSLINHRYVLKWVSLSSMRTKFRENARRSGKHLASLRLRWLEALTPTSENDTRAATSFNYPHPMDDPFSGSTTNTLPPSSSPMKTSDNFEKFADELAPLDSLPPGNNDLTLKKDLHKENFQFCSNPLFEFDDNFKSSNINSLFEENDKDVEIKSSSSFTLTSLEESEFEAYLEKDSIPLGIDLTLPPTLEVSSSNPTSPTLTEEKVCSWKMPMFFLLVRFVWKMMNQNLIRKKVICLLATYLHQKPKPLSRPQEVEEIKEKEDEVSSDVPIHTIVMPIRITFDNPLLLMIIFFETKRI
ncbi:hypothetical protein Tco_0875713 [Tanacetum coccineum]|uniref:Uncharacterized protein n=1 Tax=Tanacetum coccineum TaxID=301880 RepID=A0ABQ5BT44_9ASTR